MRTFHVALIAADLAALQRPVLEWRAHTRDVVALFLVTPPGRPPLLCTAGDVSVRLWQLNGAPVCGFSATRGPSAWPREVFAGRPTSTSAGPVGGGGVPSPADASAGLTASELLGLDGDDDSTAEPETREGDPFGSTRGDVPSSLRAASVASRAGVYSPSSSTYACERCVGCGGCVHRGRGGGRHLGYSALGDHPPHSPPPPPPHPAHCMAYHVPGFVTRSVPSAGFSHSNVMLSARTSELVRQTLSAAGKRPATSPIPQGDPFVPSPYVPTRGAWDSRGGPTRPKSTGASHIAGFQYLGKGRWRLTGGSS